MKMLTLQGQRLAGLLPAFGRAESGIAATEFALILPMFMAFTMTGIELVNRTLAQMQLNYIAASVADNAGRVRVGIDELDIEEVMIGARESGSRIKLGEKGRIILSSVEPNGLAAPNSGQFIRWQRCFGAKPVNSTFGNVNDGATDSSFAVGFGPTGRKISAVNGSAVMLIELKYDYVPITPIFNNAFGNDTWTYSFAFTVRERATHTMTNQSSIADSAKRLCTRFSST